jgi:ABC-2 type transport system permease protein
MLIPFLIVLFLFGIALGIFGSSLVLWLGPAAEWFVWPIPALIAPFAAVYYPLSTLPAWMQVLARAVAPAYVFEGMRTILAGRAFPLSQLAWALGLALIDVVIACAIFYRIYRHAVRTGLIARYSAETV